MTLRDRGLARLTLLRDSAIGDAENLTPGQDADFTRLAFLQLPRREQRAVLHQPDRPGFHGRMAPSLKTRRR